MYPMSYGPLLASVAPPKPRGRKIDHMGKYGGTSFSRSGKIVESSLGISPGQPVA